MLKGLKIWGVIAFVLGAAVALNLGNASAASAACVSNVYNKGDKGTCVKYIQVLNNEYIGYGDKLSTDGVFGAKTEKSIKKVQKAFSLKVDGIVGNQTWNLLCTTRAGWIDENGKNHMYVPKGWPLSTAKAAGCSKYWKGVIVNGVQY